VGKKEEKIKKNPRTPTSVFILVIPKLCFCKNNKRRIIIGMPAERTSGGALADIT
jgi:hypothetical protein